MKRHKVVLSSRAYTTLVTETYMHPHTETGGVFLGKQADGVWYVFEIIDPGFNEVVRESAYFEYDQNYVTHLAHVKNRLYRETTELIGLWHRHPGKLDTFSSVDDLTNKRFADMRPEGAISLIVNLDPKFRYTFYHVSLQLNYSRIEEIKIGDEYMPEGFLALQNPDEIINGRHQMVGATDYDEDNGNGGTDLDKPFEMLEKEMEVYLDVQVDYSYEIEPLGNAIKVVMKYRGRMNEYPPNIECLFFLRDGNKFCKIDGIELPYRVGIIKEYIEYAIELANKQRENGQSKKEWACRVLGIDMRKLESSDIETFTKMLNRARNHKLKETHPDNWEREKDEKLSHNATEISIEINKAYEILKKER